jgi:hypothetical protein
MAEVERWTIPVCDRCGTGGEEGCHCPPETYESDIEVVRYSDYERVAADRRAAEAERDHIAIEALAMAEELDSGGDALKRRYRSVEEIKREFFPALFAEEQKVCVSSRATKPGC